MRSRLGTLLVVAASILAPVQTNAAAPSDSGAAAMVPVPMPALPAPKLGGYIQVRSLGQDRVGLTTLLNRARFSVDGALPARFSYRLLTELQASAGARSAATVSLREAIIRWSPAPFTVTAGEFKTPFTREYLIPVPALELADLAIVVDSLAPKYDVGITADYALGATATVTLGVFNGDGANATANRDSTVMWVGRITARPMAQLTLGASGTRDGPDSLRWGLDASVQHWGGIVRAEYITRHLRGRAAGRDDFGWYVFEAFRATPRIQIVARQEDFKRPARGATARVRGGCLRHEPRGRSEPAAPAAGVLAADRRPQAESERLLHRTSPGAVLIWRGSTRPPRARGGEPRRMTSPASGARLAIQGRAPRAETAAAPRSRV